MQRSMDVTRDDEIRASILYWFESELRQYTSSPLDVMRLVAEKDKFVPVAGTESGDGPGVGPIAANAGILCRSLDRLPGDHLPFTTAPEELSMALNDLLTRNLSLVSTGCRLSTPQTESCTVNSRRVSDVCMTNSVLGI